MRSYYIFYFTIFFLSFQSEREEERKRQRDRKTDRERERSNNQLLPVCILIGDQTSNPLMQRMMLQPAKPPGQGYFLTSNNILKLNNIF